MAKQHDQSINPGVKPGQMKQRDLSRIRELLQQEPLTFQDARRGHHMPPGDAGACSRVGASAYIESPAAFASWREAITLVHYVYWDLFDGH